MLTEKKKSILSIAKRITLLWSACAISLFGITVINIPEDISVWSSGADNISVSLPFVTVTPTERAVSAQNTGTTSYTAQVGNAWNSNKNG